ncbi:MAG: TIGR01212 family radical SAM protein [Bacteroidales bacterium]|nr:TIGR01212 family radical SAM protein [Bacteroidales bacterium]MCF8403059.1 TIGR01212 family radical SAM protein [Bacteroidales bacterium]
MNYPWKDNRRFNSYAEYFRKEFGERVQKVSIDAGFTCPNRDGTQGTGGCTYCNNDAFNPSYCIPRKSVSQQIEEGIEFHKKRYRRAKKYLAYFQAYSNTYASLSELQKIYKEALDYPQVVGIVIGTRPDVIDEEKLRYFREISKTHYVIIEYGIESCYNKTLERINRKHTFEQTTEAINKTHEHGIHVGSHIIFGLPGESREEMMKEAEILSRLPLTTIKFHQLQIIKGTQMANDFALNPEEYNLFSLDDYVNFIARFVGNLNPEFIIERFTSEVPPRFLAGPGWGSVRTDKLMDLIENKMLELDIWQGKNYT